MEPWNRHFLEFREVFSEYTDWPRLNKSKAKKKQEEVKTSDKNENKEITHQNMRFVLGSKMNGDRSFRLLLLLLYQLLELSYALYMQLTLGYNRI